MRTSLEIGRRAILAQQHGLDVTSNNVANINTPGYTRQEAIFTEANPIFTPTAAFGTGVFADRVRSFREEFLDREMRGTLSRKGGFAADENMSQRIETAMREPTDYGIDSAMDDFFSSVEELNAKPEDLARRENVIRRADTLAKTFNSVGQGLLDLRIQTYESLDSDVTEMNRLLSDLAEVNKQLASSAAAGADASSTYVDRQSKLLEDLAKYGDVQISRDSKGIADVSLNGTMVVANDEALRLKLRQDVSSSGEITAALGILNKTGTQIAEYKPQSGEVASLLKHYNVTLDANDTSGGFSVAKNLDEFANAFVTQVNNIAQNGYGLNDSGTTPPGRLIFSPPPSGTNTALNITINSALLSDPAALPVASVAGEPGNNNVMRQIGQLINNQSFVGGQTARSFYSYILTKLANMGADAKDSRSVADLTQSQLTSQRESAAGVNMDEEAVNMIKFQRAFEAASRIINTTSELMQTVVNLGR